MEIIPPKKIKVISIKGKGLGVVATEDIASGEIIEHCPIIPLSEKETKFLDNESDVLKYYYLFQYAVGKHCLMLGYGSIYNHSNTPNADIDYDTENYQKYLTFFALKDIKAGEEIVYDYEFDNGKEEFLNLE